MSFDLVERLTRRIGYWIKKDHLLTEDELLLKEAAAELTRLRSENADLDAECKSSMATIAAERERADKAEALVVELVEALASVPKIAEEIHTKWDEGMRAGKLLIALIDPSLRYRADITKIHAALSRVSGGGK